MKRHLKLIISLLLVIIIASCTKSVKESEIINLIPVRNGFIFRYVDRQGKIIINPQFKEATVFRNGLALVKLFGSKPRWGFITIDGTFAIKVQYREATIFSEDVAWVVSENGAPQAINSKGDTLFTLKTAKSVRIFKDGLAAFTVAIDSVNVKWGFVDKKGTIRISPQFPAAGDYSEGKCAVTNSAGEWGYIDTDGKISINYQFTNARSFVNGKAIVQSGKEWGVIDDKGKFVISPQFSEMKADNDQYLIKQNNKWGWCNQKGNITVPAQYAEAYPFNKNELAPVKIGDMYGFINAKGKLIIGAQFSAALPFNGKLAWVKNGGKGGFIDKDAKYIIQPQYDAVSEDLKAYLLTRSSTFESVNSDYFDQDAIVNRLKKDIQVGTVAGMNSTTSISRIFKKYKKTDADFSKNGSEHKIISAERLSNDATLDFFILGTPWSETYNGKLGFSCSLIPNYKLLGISYRINLSGKGLGKEDLVLKSIEKALTGYTKDIKHSKENVIILQSKNQLIIGLAERGMIIVAIYPLNPENLQMIDQNYGDGIEADSTSVVSDSIAVK